MRASPWMVLLACASAHAADPLEGRWLGSMGNEKERVPVGLEFTQAEDGAWRVRFSNPVLNVYASDPGGTLVRDGDRVQLDSLFLDLRLDGDTLRGHLPGPRSQAELERVHTLPVEADPPKLPPGPQPAWRTRLGGLVYASPAVADGVAYIGSSGGVFQAVNVADGSLQWTYSTGKPIHGSASVAGDAVYFVCDDGALHKLARPDGKPVWRYLLGDAEVSRIPPHPAVFDWDFAAPQPLLADGVVYVGDGHGVLHAIDAQTGESRWRFASGGRIRHGAALSGEDVVFGSADGKVYALARADGRERWRFDSGAPVDTTPVLHAGRILIGNRGRGLYALDAASGAEQWRLGFWGSWIESTPVVHAGLIYIGSSDMRRISAIEPASGKVRWRTDVHGWTFGTPLIVDGRIHAGAAGGEPYFIRHRASYNTLDLATGKLLTRRELPDGGGHQWGIAGSIARDRGMLVYATIEGSLYGVREADFR